jgi:hypothetical protein
MAAAAAALAAATVSLLRLTIPEAPKLVGRGAGQVVCDVTSGLAEFSAWLPPVGSRSWRSPRRWSAVRWWC